MDYGTICSRDMDDDESGCSMDGGFWNVAMRGKIRWVDKILNEVLAKVEDDKKIMKIIQQRQHHRIGHILRHQSFYRRTNEWKTLRRKMLIEDVRYVGKKMVMWHWNEKLKTDGDGIIERLVKNLLHVVEVQHVGYWQATGCVPPTLWSLSVFSS